MKHNERKRKVFIINKSGHDYSAASKFGDIVYLTEGKLDSFETNQHYREVAPLLRDAGPDDYILITSLASLNCLVGWMIGSLGHPLNLLIFKDGKYVVRRLVDTLLFKGKGKE